MGVVAGAWQAHAHGKDCPTSLAHNGASYVAHQVTDEIGEDDLGIGTERGCGDRGPWSRDVAVSRLPESTREPSSPRPWPRTFLHVAQGVAVDGLPSDLAELVAP